VALDTSAVLAQLDSLIQEAEPRITPGSRGFSDYFKSSAPGARAMLTRMVAAITRLTPGGSVYREQAREISERSAADAGKVAWLLGVVQALRDDFAAGYLTTLEELVHADVFSEFLGMARELQRSGYKDAAAVIAGSVLEEHLRKLATKRGLPTAKPDGKPVKADTLNAELLKADAYNALAQKQVTAWLDLRNKAAHGHYTEYDHAQVAALIRDVLDFAAKHPA